jgi:5'-nucleotidase
MLGIPAIAFSQVRRGDVLHWKTAETFGADIVRRLLAVEWLDDLLMNVNFPPVPPEEVTGIEIGSQGRRISDVQVVKARDPFERDVLWIGDFLNDDPEVESSDLGIVARNAIAVTPLHFDLTQSRMLKRMNGLFADARKLAKSGQAKRKPSRAGRSFHE